MALKTSNKNRKKPVMQEEILESVTSLAEMNKTITNRSLTFSAIGVVIGLAILLLFV